MAEVMTEADVFVKLKQYLSGFPVSFPRSESGLALQVLQKIFTPEEAQVEVNMRQAPEPASAIARRCGMSEKEAERTLDSMAGKGLIWKVEGKGKPLYMAVQYIVGLLEEAVLQRMRQGTMEHELAELWEASNSDTSEWWQSAGTKQLRVVPVGAAVDATRQVATYDRIRDMVRDQANIAVMPCVCKKLQGVLDNECKRPVETCLTFGYAADHIVEAGLGRRIDNGEALQILDRAEESALVLMPNNAEELLYMCCCCSCCCGVIRALKIMERPAEQVHSSFQARIDEDLCNGCGACLEWCQMDAIADGDQVMELNTARCIGCGLCLSSCPEIAISMVVKQEAREVPSTYLDALTRMAGERGQPLGQMNRFVKKTSLSRYMKQWEIMHRLHVGEPILNLMAKRGWA